MPESRFPDSPTPYQVLGVSVTASLDEIKKAYRKAQRSTHPDLGGDPAEFARVTAAFDLIGTEQARRAFDARQGSGSKPAKSTASAAASSAPSASSAASSSPTPAQIRPPLTEGPVQVQWGKRSITVDAGLATSPVTGTTTNLGGLISIRNAPAHRTVSDYLQQRLLPQLPAARIFHNLNLRKAPSKTRGRVLTTVVAGDRAAIIEVATVPNDLYVWDGRALTRSSTKLPVTGLPTEALGEQRAGLAEALPELKIGTFLVLLTKDDQDNPLTPQVQIAGPHDPARSGLTEAPDNLRALTRNIQMFLGLGSNHFIVDRHLIGKLTLLTK